MYTPAKGCQIPGLGEIYEKHLGYKTDGRFVEAGAFNCVNWSNTKFLADIGWSGVLIEPNMCFVHDCLNAYTGNDKVHIIGCAVGDTTSLDDVGVIRKLYLGGSLSTTSEKRMAEYSEIQWAKFSAPGEKHFAYIVSTTLDSILYDIGWEPEFDVLVIDTEGTELQVLAGTDLGHWKPKLCIVETHKKSQDKGLNDDAGIIDEVMYHQKYDVVYEDHINSIYARRI